MSQIFLEDVQTKYQQSQALFETIMEEQECAVAFDYRVVIPSNEHDPIVLCTTDNHLSHTAEAVEAFSTFLLNAFKAEVKRRNKI